MDSLFKNKEFNELKLDFTNSGFDNSSFDLLMNVIKKTKSIDNFKFNVSQ